MCIRDRVHSTFGDPVRAIIALTAIGRSEDAVALFEHGGGPFFGFRHGFPALDTVLQSFGAELENRRESLLLSRLFLLFKSCLLYTSFASSGRLWMRAAWALRPM